VRIQTQTSPNESEEQGSGKFHSGLEFGVSLGGHKKKQVGKLDELDKPGISRHPRKHHPVFGNDGMILGVHLVAVPVPL
jgi:hypothetical protein